VNTQSKLAPLIREEDWWAVWFGILIILGAVLGIVDRVPKLSSWADDPTAVFTLKRDDASRFRVSDIKDFTMFADRLKGTSGSLLVQTLRCKFAAEELDLLDALPLGAPPSANLKRIIVKRLNQAVRGPNLYEPERFAGFAISDKTLESAQSSPKGSKLVKLNRNLLEEVFPTEIGVGKWNIQIALVWLWLGLALLTVIGVRVMKGSIGRYLAGFTMVFIIAFLSNAIDHQHQIKAWGLSYALWALVIGLIISNTIGTPKWLLAGARTEMYIKTGLVLMGAEILFGKILELGLPGLFVAWLVTPTVIIFMFWFGVKTLKIASKSLVIIIAAATSVCGVSAAIATAAAARAKKEELTLGVGMSLIFTVLMMVFMPLFIKAIHLDTIIGGAWMGGTIDSTGAVVAAGSMLGAKAEMVAAVVKMIQNVLIGVVAFFVAVYWVTKVDRIPGAPKPSLMEIWYRMPKFIVGFIGASVVFSFVLMPLMGSTVVETDILKDVTKNTREWLFAMAFVSIGLESNFRDLASQLVGGKPIILYIVGQSFNLVLTLIAAYLAFGGILFGKLF